MKIMSGVIVAVASVFLHHNLHRKNSSGFIGKALTTRRRKLLAGPSPQPLQISELSLRPIYEQALCPHSRSRANPILALTAATNCLSMNHADDVVVHCEPGHGKWLGEALREFTWG